MRKLKLFHQLIAFFATKSSGRKPPAYLASQAPSTSHRLPPHGAHTWVVYLHICCLCAAVSYLGGSLLYPGGSYHDRHAPGFDHFHNYLCDLWAERSHGNVHNPARPFGIATVVFLAGALTPLSLIIRRLIVCASSRTPALPLLLMMGTASGCLVFTPLHDLAIGVGFIPTAVGFLSSLVALARSGYVRIAWLGLWPFCTAVLNFALWTAGWAPFFTPFVQKVALVGLVVWALLLGAVSDTADRAST